MGQQQEEEAKYTRSLVVAYSTSGSYSTGCTSASTRSEEEVARPGTTTSRKEQQY